MHCLRAFYFVRSGCYSHFFFVFIRIDAAVAAAMATTTSSYSALVNGSEHLDLDSSDD